MDSHTPATSHTGRLHGMPLAWLLGQDDDPLYGLAAGVLEPQHVCLVGVRSFEREEDERLRAARRARYPHRARSRSARLEAVLDEALGIVTAGTERIRRQHRSRRDHPRGSPQRRHAGRGRPRERRAGARARAHRRAVRRLAAVELVEYSPRLDRDGRSAPRRGRSAGRRAMRAARGCAGRRRRAPTDSSLSFSRSSSDAERRQVEHALRRVAEEARVEVDQELVDAALAHQRAVQAEAGLDVQLVDAAARQLLQHLRQVDLSVRVRQRDDFGVLRSVARLARRRPAPCSPFRIRAPRRRLEAAVDDHAQRLARRLDLAHREARIVGRAPCRRR